MKRILMVIGLVVIALSLSCCGKRYTCMECGKKTSEAYYDWDVSEDSVMCEDCAFKYWIPFDYKDYRVK